MSKVQNSAFLVNQQLNFAQTQISLMQSDLPANQRNALKQACAWQLCSALTLFFIERFIVESPAPLYACVDALSGQDINNDICINNLKQAASDVQSPLNALCSLQASLYDKHTSVFLTEPEDTQIIALSSAPKYHWIQQDADFYTHLHTWLAEFVRTHREQTQQW